MQKKNRLTLYIIYVLAAACIFLYYLFPSHLISAFIADKVSEAHPDYAAVTEQAAPVLPPGIKLHNVTLTHLDDPVLRISEIRVKPALLTLFKPQKTYTFKGRTAGGSFEGTAAIDRETAAGQAQLNLNLAGIQIRNIPFLQKVARYPLSGILSGRVTYEKSRRPQGRASATLNLAEAVVELPIPMLGLDRLSFQYIDSEMTLAGRRVQISKCTFTGNQMDGAISGMIMLRDPVENSQLRLNGTVQPHSDLMAGLGQGLAKMILPGNKIGKNGLKFKIRGTLANPDVSL